ncbi:hypothetical protein KIL84_007474 [Mauremys mutica]|uniref:Uncharacterized protein n=1 Tax=Mauremys mutica TaxID=74926 RepID=A0A9D4AX02_9SAUR|nr:hypothetical protein KIL84_007474 [Mauremys mutica]
MQLVRSRNIQVVVVDRDVEGSAPAGTSNVAAGPNVATDVKPLETANMADNAKPLDQSKAAATEFLLEMPFQNEKAATFCLGNIERKSLAFFGILHTGEELRELWGQIHCGK